MYWDAIIVKPLSDYRLYVEVKNRGILRELQDVHYFNQVHILFGAVTWPNEQDIAPETLLAEMRPLESAGPPDRADGHSQSRCQ